MVAQVSKTCCAADFRIGVPQAGWETRDTADLESALGLRLRRDAFSAVENCSRIWLLSRL